MCMTGPFESPELIHHTKTPLFTSDECNAIVLEAEVGKGSMTHWYMCYVSFIRVTWLVIWVRWPTLTCTSAPSRSSLRTRSMSMAHVTLVNESCPYVMAQVWRSHVTHVKYCHVINPNVYVRADCVTRLMHTCDMTLLWHVLWVWFDSDATWLMSGIWLTCDMAQGVCHDVCDATVSCVPHESELEPTLLQTLHLQAHDLPCTCHSKHSIHF